MVKLKTNVRVRAEGSGITAKSLVTFLVLVVDGGRGRLALLAFAVGQLGYSVVCLGVYLGYLGGEILRPKMRCVWFNSCSCVGVLLVV
jgi:oligosaccharide translocation protein RFT1